MPQRSGFARTGMAFENADRLPRRGEPRLRLRPRRRAILLVPKIAHAQRQIVFVVGLHRHRRVIVVVADIAQHQRALGSRNELAGFAQRHRVLRCPPRVKVAAAVASQARAPPTPVRSLRRFVVLPPGVHRQPLHKQRRPPADRVPPVR